MIVKGSKKNKRNNEHDFRNIHLKRKHLDDEINSLETSVREFNEKANSSLNIQSLFESFPVSIATQKGLKKAGFITPTDVQRLTLPYSLAGSDVVGAAKTGSGKTLALLIPILECLWKNKWTKFDGLGALIITPTRELAYQIYEVINQIGRFHDFSVAVLIGGTDFEFEKSRIAQINVVICTPGRLFQHMNENELFSCDHLQILAIDETDRILDMGFREQVDAILEYLPKLRQTLLFSATQTKKVEDLIRISLKDPVFLSAHDDSVSATPDQLNQYYFICKDEEKINALWSFITDKKCRRKKTLVFVTCCKQARFISQAFFHMKPPMTVIALWGDMKQTKRIEHYTNFNSKGDGAVMISTDLASRGLDFKNLDCVIQMDCPADVDDYIHRVGRTARMASEGEAILFLTPQQESVFIESLIERKIPISQTRCISERMKDIKLGLSNLYIQFPELKQFSQRSIVSYAKAIYFMANKKVFNVDSIDFEEMAKFYGLPFVPRIRFLRKRGCFEKANNTIVETVNLEKSSLSNELGGQFLMPDDSADDEVLKIVRRDVFNSIDQVDVNEDIISRLSSKKAITKTVVARKMFKRMGTVSKRKRFSSDSSNDNET